MQVALCDQSHLKGYWLAEHGLEPPPHAELIGEEPSLEELEGQAEGQAAAGLGAAAELTLTACASPQAAEPAAGPVAGMEAAADDGTPADVPGEPVDAVCTASSKDPSVKASTAAAAPTAGEDAQQPSIDRDETGRTSRPATSKGRAAGSRPPTGQAASRPATGTPALGGSSRLATGRTASAGVRPASGKAASSSLPARKGKGKAAMGKTQPATDKAKAKGSRHPATAVEQADRPKGVEASTCADEPPATDAAAAQAEAQPPASEARQDPQVLLPPPTPPRPSSRRKRYVHAFVLLRAGRREVTQPLLLDPGSGRIYGMHDAPCTGVECAWSERNFWVSLQTDSGSSNGSSNGSRLAELGAMDWSFSNPNCWLALLPDREARVTQEGTGPLLLTCCFAIFAYNCTAASLLALSSRILPGEC